MPRILTRPLFRKGGLSRETGIMSGLDTPRRSYAGGGNIGGGFARGIPMGNRTGFQTTFSPNLSQPSGVRGQIRGMFDVKNVKDAGKKILEEAAKKTKFQGLMKLLRKFPDLAKRLGTKIPLSLSQSAAAGPVTGMIAPVAAGAAIGTGIGKAADWATRATDTPEAYAYRKKVVREDPYAYHETDLEIDDEGNYYTRGSEYDKKIKELDVGEKPGFFPRGGIKKWREDRGLDPETGEKIVTPENEVTKIDPLDTTGGEKKLTGDMESDLMRAYKEYAPIFEKELGVSSEDTKKQLWMQLAKFGAGVAAQPGGDLVGAIGKAAEKPLEGAGEVVKDVSTAKRQAKLLALQTAISENQPGNVGKALKDIAKAYKVSMAEAADIYAKWQTNNTTARAADVAAYRKFAEDKGVNPIRFPINIKKLLDDPDLADLVGKFNEKLPDDIEDAENKEYYITTQGDLVRVVDGEILTSKEPGFKYKPKEK